MPTPEQPHARRGVPPPHQRLPDSTRLGRVALQVGDLERSLRYYQTVIGLRLLERDGGRATLGPHGDERVLVELRCNPKAQPIAAHSRLGLYHFALLLPTRAALGSFVRHLAELGVYAGMSDHLVSEALYLTDPDGLGIEVYADRPRTAWPRSGNEIAMASDPIDVEDLVRAGDGAPWAGVPAGTVLGHLHLYVDDLERATEFYHRGLGFDITVASFPGARFVSAGGYHHHLGFNTWARGATVAERDEPRLLFWEILVPHPAAIAAADSLKDLAAEVTHEGGTWRAIDPWGTTVHLRAGPGSATPRQNTEK